MSKNFIDSVRMDLGKCVGFSLTFLSPEEIFDVVFSTCDKYLLDIKSKDVN